MKSNRGFTLLEVLVAAAIMGMAVVGLLAALSGATHNASRLRDHDRAVLLARRQMGELIADTRLPRNGALAGDFTPDQCGGLESGWRAKLSDFAMPPAGNASRMAVERIELEVWWMSGSERRAFTLEGFQRRVLRDSEMPQAVAK